MVLMNHRELGQMYRKLGARKTCQHIQEGLELGRSGKPGGLKSSDFSLRECAESLVENGREWVRSMDPRNGGGVAVMEAGDAVDSTAFSNITGQLVINEIMAAYESEEFMFSRMFKTVSTNLSGEKIPGITGLGDKTQTIAEGMPYPNVGIGEDYTETPATDKHGLIVPVTKEAIFFDRTGLMLERASKVGESLGINKEKRCIGVAIGGTNNYKWRGTSYDTYQTATPWINKLAGATYALVDWTQVEQAELLFAGMVDPNTGEPIMMSGMTIAATPFLKHTINRVFNATEIRYIGTSANTETLASNPITGYNSVISRLLYSRLQAAAADGGLAKSAADAKTCWFMGDFAKAFAYMENWPITVVQAPTNSTAEFERDIVAQFKASERGVAAVKDPRYVVRVDGHA